MAKTEFHDPNDKSEDRFDPVPIRVEGSFIKFWVQLSHDGNRVAVTTYDGRQEYSVATARELIEALQATIDHIEGQNPPEPKKRKPKRAEAEDLEQW